MKVERAPRLANKQSRVRWWPELPKEIKDGLRAIAKRERKSMSWVVEEVIIDYFSLRRPKYRERPRAVRKAA